MKKIITWIAGGLGNQLFQYAAARSLAIENNCELVLDTSFFYKPRKRKFRLDEFNCQARKLSIFEFIMIKLNKLNVIEKVFAPKGILFQIDETSSQTGVDSLSLTVYMRGYWQDENYFSRHREEILKEITLKTSLPTEVQALGDLMSSESSISIHIRRGDYI